MLDDFDREMFFRRVWESIRIERYVEYSLFTFGDSELPYFLVTPQKDGEENVRIRRGQITVSRARIITPENMHPEFRDFFEDHEDDGLAGFLMSRAAAFSNMKLSNHCGSDNIVTDTVEEAVDRLNKHLDREDEDRVAILSAPVGLAGAALLKYATARISDSAPGNLTELREKGFLP